MIVIVIIINFILLIGLIFIVYVVLIIHLCQMLVDQMKYCCCYIIRVKVIDYYQNHHFQLLHLLNQFCSDYFILIYLQSNYLSLNLVKLICFQYFHQLQILLLIKYYSYQNLIIDHFIQYRVLLMQHQLLFLITYLIHYQLIYLIIFINVQNQWFIQ